MQEETNKQKRMTLKTVHQMLDGMSVELAEKVHLLFMAFFRFPPSPLAKRGSTSPSGEGKIENFENPSFSKFWYRSRSLCPKGRAMRFYEMDINLEVFNLETDFFGDLHSSSRFTDMLCDAQAQYGDYSELGKCPMWGMWKKEGGDKGPTESRRERGLKK